MTNTATTKASRDQVVYVSGAYASHGDVTENINKARKVAIRLWERGFTVICPHLNTAFFDEDSTELKWEDYMDGDKELIKRSDIVYMMKGWEHSKGAVLEHEWAEQFSKIIMYEVNDG